MNFQFSIFNFKSNHKSSIINHKSAFTLIELLVVIAIIGTFITAGLGSFATAQKKGRDTKRKTDIKEIQIALEQYYSVCGYVYPTPGEPTPGIRFYTNVDCPSPSLAILPTVPVDPRKITPYYCPTPGATNCSGTGYTICAVLESEAGTFCVNNAQ